MIAYAKWEVYEHGRPDLERLREPMRQADEEVDEFGLLREVAHEYFCRCNGEAGKKGHLRKSLDFRTISRNQFGSRMYSIEEEMFPKLTYEPS